MIDCCFANTSTTGEGGCRVGWGGRGAIRCKSRAFFFLENIIYFFLVSSRSVVTLPLGKLKAGAAWWRGSGLGVCEVSRCCYFFQLNLYLYFHLSLYLCLYLNLEEQYLREGGHNCLNLVCAYLRRDWPEGNKKSIVEATNIIEGNQSWQPISSG